MSTATSPSPVISPSHASASANAIHSHHQARHQCPTSPTQLAVFMRNSTATALINEMAVDPEEEDNLIVHPHREQMHRRDAIVPEDQPSESDRENGGDTAADCNVLIVPHLQVSADREGGGAHLYNRAITAGGGLLADLQRATLATHQFYAETNGTECQSKARSPWILRRLYEWSHRAKSREMLKHVHAALDSTTNGSCSASEGGAEEDEHLEQLLSLQWEEMFFLRANGQAAADMAERAKRRLKSVWELFHSELVFLTRQLLVLRNVYKEPLKKCQVEGCLLGVEPELLFGNLDQLIRISRRFCHSFLALLEHVKCAGPPFGTTEMVVQLFKRFAKGPSTISAYQAYCINYKAIIEYLGSVRQKEERFVDFERVCMGDQRCGRLQLEDLLISPLQRITRLPILLREILRHTEPQEERQSLEKVLEQMNESLRSIDDSVQWLHNFERLQQLQHQIIWPPVIELEPKTYIPDFLKGALSRQFCENLLAHPRRKLVHEGHVEHVENGRTSDCYCFLFNDMFLITKVKKVTLKSRKNSSSLMSSKQQEFYIVHRQPIPLDSCVFCDAESDLETQQNVILKNAFVVLHLTRYYQVLNVYTMQSVNKREKEIWIEKFQEGIENYESIQLKDMLRCTPLFSSLSIRRSSSARSHGSAGGSSPVNSAAGGSGLQTSSSAPPNTIPVQLGANNASNCTAASAGNGTNEGHGPRHTSK